MRCKKVHVLKFMYTFVYINYGVVYFKDLLYYYVCQ